MQEAEIPAGESTIAHIAPAPDIEIHDVEYRNGVEYVTYTEIEMYECDVCGDEFTSEEALYGHKSAHDEE